MALKAVFVVEVHYRVESSAPFAMRRLLQSVGCYLEVIAVVVQRDRVGRR